MRLSENPCARQAAALLARGSDDPFADVDRDRAFCQRLDECAGNQDTLLRMSPAQQGFHPDDRVVRKPDLGLEIELELVLGKCATQLDVQPAARLRLRAQNGHEKRKVRPPSDFA